MTWAPNFDGGSPITGYVVTASFPGGTTTCSPAAATETSCTLTGLTNGQSYSIFVQATNGAGTSLASTVLFAAPMAPEVPAAAPSAPTAVRASPAMARSTVSWAAPASTGGSPITGYTVTASPGGTTCQTTDALTCTMQGLANGTRLHVHRDGHQRHRHEPRLRRLRPVTPVAPATPVTPVTPVIPVTPATPATPATSPAAPTLDAPIAADSMISVSWTPSSDGGSPITGYVVTATAADGTWTCAPAW